MVSASGSSSMPGRRGEARATARRSPTRGSSRPIRAFASSASTSLTRRRVRRPLSGGTAGSSRRSRTRAVGWRRGWAASTSRSSRSSTPGAKSRAATARVTRRAGLLRRGRSRGYGFCRRAVPCRNDSEPAWQAAVERPTPHTIGIAHERRLRRGLTMSVTMRLDVTGDPKRLEQFASQNKEKMQAVLEAAKRHASHPLTARTMAAG